MCAAIQFFNLYLPAQAVANWMPPPQEVVPGCPPGLEYLTQVDQLLVNQMIETFERKH